MTYYYMMVVSSITWSVLQFFYCVSWARPLLLSVDKTGSMIVYGDERESLHLSVAFVALGFKMLLTLFLEFKSVL